MAASWRPLSANCWSGAATGSAPSSTTATSSGPSRPGRAATRCSSCSGSSASGHGRRGTARSPTSSGLLESGRPGRPPPVSGRAHLRLHQRAGLGAAAAAAHRPARGGRRPAGGPPGVRAARRRAAVRPGRRDRRAAAGRHQRPRAAPPAAAPPEQSASRRSSRRPPGRASTSTPLSTDDDLVSAFVRMAGIAKAAAPMSFLAPWMLLGLLALPVVAAAYVVGARAAIAAGQPPGRPGPGRHCGRGAGRGGAATCRSRCSCWPWPFSSSAGPGPSRPSRRRAGRPRSSWPWTCPTAWRPPTSSPPGSRRPRRPRTLRRPPAVGGQDRGGGLRQRRGDRPDAHDRSRRCGQRHRPPVARRRNVGGPGTAHLARRHRRQELTINEQDLASDAGRPNIGYYGSASVVMFSDGENVSGPIPSPWPRWRRWPASASRPSGSGPPAGTVVQIDGFTVATALDQRLLQKIATVTNGSYHAATAAGGLAAISRAIDLQFKIVSRAHRDHGPVRRRRRAPAPRRRRPVGAVVGTGGVR